MLDLKGRGDEALNSLGTRGADINSSGTRGADVLCVYSQVPIRSACVVTRDYLTFILH